MATKAKKRIDPKELVKVSKEEHQAKLIEAIQNLLTNDTALREYFNVVGRAYHYSFFNTLLIHLQAQKLGLSPVCDSYKRWQQKHKRQVRSGEHAQIVVYRPVHQYFPLRDKDTGELIVNAKGKQQLGKRLIGFSTVGTFSVSQTDGPEMRPPRPVPVTDDSNEAREVLASVMEQVEKLGVEVFFRSPAEDSTLKRAYGYFDPDRPMEVVIMAGLPAAQQAATILHEAAHALTHHLLVKDERYDYSGGEIVAESSAFMAMSAFGIDTSSFSVEYIAKYARTNMDKVIDMMRFTGKVFEKLIGVEHDYDNGHNGQEAQ